MYEIHGKVFQDGDMWLSEIPRLNLMTQGTSRTDAIEMIIDAIKCLSDEFIHLRLFYMSPIDGSFVLLSFKSIEEILPGRVNNG